jgi:hypothetical protein
MRCLVSSMIYNNVCKMSTAIEEQHELRISLWPDERASENISNATTVPNNIPAVGSPKIHITAT